MLEIPHNPITNPAGLPWQSWVYSYPVGDRPMTDQESEYAPPVTGYMTARKLATFRADGFRDVQAQSARDAAEIFATRQARRDYGRNGHCRLIRLDNWTTNGQSWTFNAFIGRPVRGENATSGRIVWVYVRRVG